MEAKTLTRQELNNLINTVDLEVHRAGRNGGLVAWDGAHCVYVATDEDGASYLKKKKYRHVKKGSTLEMMRALVEWYDSSESVRFVKAVRQDPNGSKNPEIVDLIEEAGEA